MLRTLRGQLIFSHILPTLIIIPLMGIALLYFFESWVIIPSYQRQLRDDAFVIARIARAQPQIFSNASTAHDLVQDLGLQSATRVMIISPDGKLLASSSTSDDSRLGQILAQNGIPQALSGAFTEHVDFSKTLDGDVVDIFMPVIGQDNQVIGIVRLSYRYMTVLDQLVEMRYLIVLILTLGALFSAILGYLLAISIANPIHNVTHAINDLASGVRAEPLAIEGTTEIKTLETSANILLMRLRELQKSRRQLLSNLVHELGRPLGGLQISLQVLRDGAKEDPKVLDELLTGMLTETSLLKRLLEDLAHLHDQVIGTLELDYEEVDLSTWLPVVIQTSHERALRKGLKWCQEIPTNLPRIVIDPHRIAQVIGNLITNAIKYTPKGGSVIISAGENEDNDRVWMRISDTGPGIPVEEQHKIFEPLYRGKNNKRIQQGMGLGLSIAKDLVEAHHGQLELASTPGEGSQFTIYLPKDFKIDSGTGNTIQQV
jgi:two-component system sensor histidine kinase BaeS